VTKRELVKNMYAIELPRLRRARQAGTVDRISSIWQARQAATMATDLACRAVGRRRVVRIARFVLWRARLDGRNDMRSNGELFLQRWILDLSRPGDAVHVVDVGANKGRWSEAMLDAARRAGRQGDVDLHAFEPSSYTFARLSEELDGQAVNLHQAALGDTCGLATLHVVAPAAGTNSLHEAPEAAGESSTEDVALTTLDTFARRNGLHHLTLVKIDTEGHDLAVLRGARALFAEQRISIAQFEYNHRWVYARFFLRDAFEMLEPLGYHLGKLTQRGVEFYPGWDADLEMFIEGNYVACASHIADRLPSVAWWKSR
jgi:FkbM family methyltransferase